MNQTPQLTGGHLSPQPASLPQQGYNISQSMYAENSRSYRAQAVSRAPAAQPTNSRRPSDGQSGYGTPKTIVAQPTQESSSRMAQSAYASPAPHSAPQLPLPSERKIFKCPRCDIKFTVLLDYRAHINVCLKS